MPVSSELLEILVCPETKQPVRPADAAVLASLNERVDAGSLRNRGGDAVSKRIEEALVRDLTDHFQRFRGTRIPSCGTLVTGPSKTADIEQTLVMGAHGPRRLMVLMT